MLDESRGRVFKEPSAGASEGAHLFGTVSLHEQGRRAARGVVAGVRLPFQHHDARMPGQKVSHGGPGDTGPDDYEISIFHQRQYAITSILPCEDRPHWPPSGWTAPLQSEP